MGGISGFPGLLEQSGECSCVFHDCMCRFGGMTGSRRVPDQSAA